MAVLQDLAPELIPSTIRRKISQARTGLISRADGLQLHGQLFLPSGAHDGRRHPTRLLHGGSRREMLLGFHTMQYYSNAYAMNQYLASLGYIVLSVNYRSGIGYGLDSAKHSTTAEGGASDTTTLSVPETILRGQTRRGPGKDRRLGRELRRFF